MLKTLRHALLERVRCAKHNWLDGVDFRMRYSCGIYHVRTAEGMEFRLPFNPYTSFFEIGGYLAERKWRLEPGMVVVDAGGGRGEFSLYASRCVGAEGRVFMLEPDPRNRAAAQGMFDLNGGCPANLTVLPLGLWKEQGTLSFAAGLGGSSMLVDVGAASCPPGIDLAAAEVVRIEVCSLPGLVEAQQLDRLDFVKMDIEGAEVEVIQGAGPVMQQLRPRFAIAAYHLRDGRKTCEFLAPIFRAAGYHSRTGFPQHLTTYASAEHSRLP